MTSTLPCLRDLPSYTEAVNELQKIVFDTNKAAFSSYKNAFQGKDVVIVGTGPTIKFLRKKHNAIYIGVNSSVLLDTINLDYYFNLDYGDYVELANEYKLSKNIFYGKNLPFWPHNIPDHCIQGYATKFYVNYSEKKANQYNFSDNILHNIINMPKSVIFSAMLFALYTNPKRIFLAGCDCGASQIAADGSQRTNSANLDYMPLIEGWKAIKSFADKQYPDTEIISINPRGLAGIFRDEFQNIEAVKAVEAKDCGEMLSALEHARLALAQDPNNPGLLSLVAELLRTLDKEEFFLTAESWLATQPDWADGYRQMALYQENQNKEEEALSWVRKGIKQCPQNFPLRLLEIQLLRRFKRVDALNDILMHTSSAFKAYVACDLFRQTWWNSNTIETIKLLKESLSLTGQFSYIYYFLVNILRGTGNSIEAEHTLLKALSIHPDAPEFYRQLAWIALERGKPFQALEYARQMWELAPGWTYSAQLMLQVLLRLNRVEEALTLAQEIQAVTPNEDFLPHYLAKIYQAKGDLDSAIAYAHEAAYRYPILRERYRLEYIVTYASLLQKKGETREAETLLRTTLAFHSDSSQLWRALSSLYASEGDPEQALCCAREAAKQEPDINGSWLHLINILQSLHKWDEADEILRHRLEVTPGWGVGWRKLSELCEARKLEDWEDTSLSYAHEAVQTDPKNTGLIHFFITKIKKKSKTAAITEYQTALKNNPDWGMGWAFLSSCCEELKDHQSAIYYARKAATVSPENPWCRGHLIDALLANSELDTAEKEARTFLEQLPQNAIACRQMAKVCKARKQPVQAFLWLQRACSFAPMESDTVWTHLIDLLRDMKDESAEKNFLLQAVHYNPQWKPGYKRLLQLCKNDNEKEEIYRKALKFNPNWAEAWYQLSFLADKRPNNKRTLNNIIVSNHSTQ